DEAPVDESLPAAQIAWLADPRVTSYVADPRGDQKLPEWARRETQLPGVNASVFLPMRAGQRFVGFVALHWRRPRWNRPEQLRRPSWRQLIFERLSRTSSTEFSHRSDFGRAGSTSSWPIRH